MTAVRVSNAAAPGSTQRMARNLRFVLTSAADLRRRDGQHVEAARDEEETREDVVRSRHTRRTGTSRRGSSTTARPWGLRLSADETR
jgi:hypothetical protein